MTVILSLPSQACIWQSENKSGASPFWASNNIEVCFARPQPIPMGNNVQNPLDFEYRRNYQNNINLMKLTIEEQFNNRTAFHFSGFGFCEAGDTSQKMRIDLNGTQGEGAMASSIGPRSSRDDINIMINSLDQDWPGGVKPANIKNNENLPQRVRVFNDPRHMSWVALHEMMHLLGFHHAESWDSDMSGSDPDIAKAVQYGDTMDQASVMARGAKVMGGNGRAVLSETDVACLNLVANRQIMNYPQRDAARGVTRQLAPVIDRSGGVKISN